MLLCPCSVGGLAGAPLLIAAVFFKGVVGVPVAARFVCLKRLVSNFCFAESGSGQVVRVNLNGHFDLDPATATPEVETITTTAARTA